MAYSDTNKDPIVGDKVYSLYRLNQGNQPNGEVYNVDPDHECIIVKYFEKLQAIGIVAEVQDFVEYDLSTFRSCWKGEYMEGMYFLEDI